MSPAPSTPRRGGMSLEHKLPLLITALLVVTMAAGVLFTYSKVKQASVAAATERLQLVSRQLADLAAAALPQRLVALSASTRDPAILAVLRTPDAASRSAAAAVLHGLRSPQDSTLPVMVWDRSRRPVARIGSSPEPGDDAGSGPMYAPQALPDSTGYGPFVSRGNRAYFWAALPVRSGADTLGYVAALRRIGGANTAASIQALIGRGIDVYFANAAGGPWVTLDGEVTPPPAPWPFAGAAQYRHGRGGEHFGSAARLAGTPWSMVAEQPRRAVLAAPAAFLRQSGVAALLLLLAGAAGAWLLSRSITRPLKELRLAAAAIERGDYDRRINLSRADELGALADSFNTMASQVEASTGELREQYETAQSLAEELEQTNEQLEMAAGEAEAARHEAETANRSKSDFLATMSHEIRTPINAIVGYTDLLHMGLSGPVNEAQQAQLERIRVSGQHLIGLVDQVLDFARIESGTLRVERRPASAAAAVETALTVLRPQAVARGVELVDACAGDAGLRYLGDPQRVEQILVNLLSNAIKFTEPGGRAALRCTAVDGRPPGDATAGRWVSIVVEDTGAGIHPEQLARIFEPFVQVDSSYTRRHEGTGLGLAISLRLARSMGGEIGVESAPGKGSRFTLWLPAVEGDAGEGASA